MATVLLLTLAFFCLNAMLSIAWFPDILRSALAIDVLSSVMLFAVMALVWGPL